jgi:hypothetical protein
MYNTNLDIKYAVDIVATLTTPKQFRGGSTLSTQAAVIIK